MNYKIKYITEHSTIASTIINAANKFHLAQLIQEKITDMKDDDSDNIVAIEEV